ncbi:MAG TPA: MOSC domain-containing protein [Thermoanaerobaculia bacterium]|nr:MOSC domain-containing protein [Thermoanaerobaculia bacterium]
MSTGKKVVSVNVGLPCEVMWNGDSVLTSIFKKPVAGRVRVETLNLAGDQQSDLTVHGGPEKAVYVYPSEHYAFWRDELPGVDLPWGSFGENLTVEGLAEGQLRIGDEIAIGSAVFVVTQPRMPCFKLGIRFGRMDMVKRFLKSGRSGFYLSVSREGKLSAGDPIALTPSQAPAITVAEFVSIYATGGRDKELLRRAVLVPAIPEGWRDYLHERLGEDAS